MALFNLGVAYREAGSPEQAYATFAELAEMDAYDEETFDLTQRARLAMAYVNRAANKQMDAATLLGELPSEGRYRDVALASYGNLAMANGDYELAARIWMTLQNQPYWTSSTAAARIGFPVSLEKLASTELALEQYQVAADTFETRLTALEGLSRQAEDPVWVRDLLEVFSSPEADRDQLKSLMERWEAELGHTQWLEWLSTETVHALMTEWRELGAMQKWLNALPETISTLEGVAREQRRRTGEAKALLSGDELLARRATLAERKDMLGAEVAALRAAEPTPEPVWMLALANDAERETLRSLYDAREQIAAHGEDKDKRKWLPRIDRMIGLHFYHLVDDRSVRLRALDNGYRVVEETLADVDARITRVANAEQEFSMGVETNFATFIVRADAITAQVAAARRHREEQLAFAIRDGMHREMEQVQRYLLVTRIAIARATDQLASRGEAP